MSEDIELLKFMGTDARKWATEFCSRNPDVDFDTMVGWFANAINAGRYAPKTKEKQIKIKVPNLRIVK